MRVCLTRFTCDAIALGIFWPETFVRVRTYVRCNHSRLAVGCAVRAACRIREEQVRKVTRGIINDDSMQPACSFARHTDGIQLLKANPPVDNAPNDARRAEP